MGKLCDSVNGVARSDELKFQFIVYLSGFDSFSPFS